MKTGHYIIDVDEGLKTFTYNPSFFTKIRWKINFFLGREKHLRAKFCIFVPDGDDVQALMCQENGQRAARMFTGTGKWHNETISIKIVNTEIIEMIVTLLGPYPFYIDSLEVVEY